MFNPRIVQQSWDKTQSWKRSCSAWNDTYCAPWDTFIQLSPSYWQAIKDVKFKYVIIHGVNERFSVFFFGNDKGSFAFIHFNKSCDSLRFTQRQHITVLLLLLIILNEWRQYMIRNILMQPFVQSKYYKTKATYRLTGLTVLSLLSWFPISSL